MHVKSQEWGVIAFSHFEIDPSLGIPKTQITIFISRFHINFLCGTGVSVNASVSPMFLKLLFAKTDTRSK